MIDRKDLAKLMVRSTIKLARGHKKNNVKKTFTQNFEGNQT